MDGILPVSGGARYGTTSLVLNELKKELKG